ncbi:MAG: hypothetical protein ABJO09_20625 [Hyphomicrobiales bacterium]
MPKHNPKKVTFPDCAAATKNPGVQEGEWARMFMLATPSPTHAFLSLKQQPKASTLEKLTFARRAACVTKGSNRTCGGAARRS